MVFRNMVTAASGEITIITLTTVADTVKIYRTMNCGLTIEKTYLRWSYLFFWVVNDQFQKNTISNIIKLNQSYNIPEVQIMIYSRRFLNSRLVSVNYQGNVKKENDVNIKSKERNLT